MDVVDLAQYIDTHTHLALTVCIQLVNGMEMASVLVSSCVFFFFFFFQGLEFVSFFGCAVPCMSCIIKRHDPSDLDPPSFFGR